MTLEEFWSNAAFSALLFIVPVFLGVGSLQAGMYAIGCLVFLSLTDYVKREVI